MSNATVRTDGGDQIIAERIERARFMIRRADFLAGLMSAALCFFGGLTLWILTDHWLISAGGWLRAAALLAVVGATVVVLVWKMRPLWGRQVNPEYAALAIEKELPELEHTLVSYQALRDQRTDSSLRGVVVRSVGAVAARRLNSNPDVDGETNPRLNRLATMLVATIVFFVAYAFLSPKNSFESLGRLLLPTASVGRPTRVRITEVVPGKANILEGAALAVQVKTRGAANNDLAEIEVEPTGERPFKVPLTTGEVPQQFDGVVTGPDGIRKSFQYTVRIGDASAGPFNVQTQSVPTVSIDEVRLRPPAYTRLPERVVKRGAIEGVEGTEVTLVARTNRPVAKAKFEFNPNQKNSRVSIGSAPAVRISDDGRTLQAVFYLRGREDDPAGPPQQSYRLLVTDRDGNENPEPVVYPIRVTLDRAPVVEIATPRDWPKEVPVNGQQLIEVRTLDPDFGLTETRLEIQFDVRTLARPELLRDEVGVQGERVCLYRFRPDEIGLHAGQRNVKVRAVSTDNRHRIASQDLEPNVTATEPITLHIGRAQDQAAQDKDGLQKRDNKPAVEKPKAQGKEAGENQGKEGETSPDGKSQQGDSPSRTRTSKQRAITNSLGKSRAIKVRAASKVNKAAATRSPIKANRTTPGRNKTAVNRGRAGALAANLASNKAAKAANPVANQVKAPKAQTAAVSRARAAKTAKVKIVTARRATGVTTPAEMPAVKAVNRDLQVVRPVVDRVKVVRKALQKQVTPVTLLNGLRNTCEANKAVARVNRLQVPVNKAPVNPMMDNQMARAKSRRATIRHKVPETTLKALARKHPMQTRQVSRGNRLTSK